jgi:penicillin-binding protein 2
MANSRIKSDLLVDPVRIYIVVVTFLVIVMFLIGRLWYLQILNGKNFSIASERNRMREVPISAPRGIFFDRHGETLLSNRPFFDLVVIPQFLQEPQKTLAIIGELFNMKPEHLEKKIQDAIKSGVPKFAPVRLKRNLSMHEVAIVESNKFFLPGVDVEIAPRRDYTRNESAHLLGYLGEITSKEFEQLANMSRDNPYQKNSVIGKMGAERKFETLLHGSEGKEYLQVDAYGRLQPNSDLDFGLYPKQESQRGMDVFLTVDSTLQSVAMESFRNKNGAVVALDPRSGEILAYVSNPNFELTLYQDGLSNEDWQNLQTNPFKPLLDKVTGGAYPPGSTYKMLVGLAALEEGLITPEKSFFCGGSYTLGSKTWGCHKKTGHGSVNVSRALEVSCDVFFYQTGNLLGVDRLSKWASLFGFGEKTNLDLNMELPGLNPTKEWKLRTKGIPWTPGDNINLSIGQGFNLTTPLQVANLFAAIGTKGYLYKPYLLKKVVNHQGTIVREESPKLIRKIALKEQAIQPILKGVYDVVNGPSGTGKKAQVPGFSVSGKTGTAQTSVLRKAKDQEDISFLEKDHAWFGAFSPSENPEIVVVVLSEYDGQGGGSQAAPIAQKVIEAYWRKKEPEKFALAQSGTSVKKVRPILPPTATPVPNPEPNPGVREGANQ